MLFRSQWLFFEQYSHEPYIAVLRFWRHFLETLTPAQEIRLPELLEKGHAALRLMENHLKGRQFLVAESYSIADIALFAYTHVAEEGGFDLTPYHNLKGWISRVQNAPGYIPIDRACGS